MPEGGPSFCNSTWDRKSVWLVEVLKTDRSVGGDKGAHEVEPVDPASFQFGRGDTAGEKVTGAGSEPPNSVNRQFFVFVQVIKEMTVDRPEVRREKIVGHRLSMVLTVRPPSCSLERAANRRSLVFGRARNLSFPAEAEILPRHGSTSGNGSPAHRRPPAGSCSRRDQMCPRRRGRTWCN
jgi:hypothetical protein